MIEIVENSPGVRKLIHLRTMHLGPEEVLVGMKIVVDDAAPALDVTQFIDLVEARLRAELPILKRIYVEIGASQDPKSKMTASIPAQSAAAGGDTDTI